MSESANIPTKLIDTPSLSYLGKLGQVKGRASRNNKTVKSDSRAGRLGGLNGGSNIST